MTSRVSGRATAAFLRESQPT